MMSWTLGRASGRKEKKQEPAQRSPRPQSMVLSFPSTSSSAELASTLPPSSSLAFSTLEHGSHQDENEAPTSALSSLNSAQRKDKGRRQEATSSVATTPPSPRPQKAAGSGRGRDRERTRSLPSLIKPPGTAPSTTVSPAAAMARGAASHAHQGLHSITSLDGSVPLSDGEASMQSVDSLAYPPSPSPRPGAHKGESSAGASGKGEEGAHQVRLPPDLPASSLKKEHKRPKGSGGVAKESPATALASLRRFKEVDGIGTRDRKRLDHVNDVPVEEPNGSENVKAQDEAVDEEVPSYAFTVRKRSGAAARGCGSVSKLNARWLEVGCGVGLVTQTARSWSFHRQNQGGLTGQVLIATSLPSLLGCDRAAGWAVERSARLTSCIIYALGS